MRKDIPAFDNALTSAHRLLESGSEGWLQSGLKLLQHVLNNEAVQKFAIRKGIDLFSWLVT
jgi:hypothetical protein